ncbi:glycosyltransferase family 2 protein [Roseomonas fluvialis]|nr:glycosyltransferase family 2 protein [Roseomonas fluvialis]
MAKENADAAQRKMADLERQLADVQASTSWRLTAPLRAVGYALRSVISRRRATPEGQTRSEPACDTELATSQRRHPEDEAKQEFRRSCSNALAAFLAGSTRLALPRSATPRVSVIIVVHNQAELTFACLESLAREAPLDTEVIIVNNASTDSTSALLKRIDGVCVVNASENLHFLRGVNRASLEARGRHLLLLNNDTIVAPGAIKAASDRLDQEPDLGAVGGMILRLDGTLQEAGCITWRDGHCEGYGRGEHPESPAFAFTRDVDYCSGAFLMVRRQVFEALGGLDEVFAPAYFEEVDLCMRIRAAGFRVGYEPRAQITHFEYGSVESSASAKALYDRNHVTFVERYGSVLRSAHLDPTRGALAARARTPHPGAVLLLDGAEDVGDETDSLFRDAFTSLRLAGTAITYLRLAPTDRPGMEENALRRSGIEVVRAATLSEIRAFLAEREKFYSLVIHSASKNVHLVDEAIAAISSTLIKDEAIALGRADVRRGRPAEGEESREDRS